MPLHQPLRRADPPSRWIDERTLDGFRAERLSPEALRRLVEAEVRVLVKLGVGVGKSRAVDELLCSTETYSTFDLIIYVSASWAIVNERRVVRDPKSCPVESRIIRPRPAKRCGPYRSEWTRLEQQVCFAYGKSTLCSPCQIGMRGAARCYWPNQYRDLGDVKLALVTEAHLTLNRSLLHVIVANTGANRPLVILDEAEFIERPFATTLDPTQLRTFRDALSTTALRAGGMRAKVPWLADIDSLLTTDEAGLTSGRLDLPPWLLREAYDIQAAGIEQFGEAYRFLGYDLLALKYSQPSERFKDANGRIRFIARPYLGAHLMILSAHLTSKFVAHRLACGFIASPFERTFVRHSKTRIFNVRNSIGAEVNFRRNYIRVLDAFAVLVLDNVAHGRSTVLVARKMHTGLCARYLEKRLRDWGVKIRCVAIEKAPPSKRPDPSVVPIIHYGVRGINAFEEYDSCFCVTGYYVSAQTLNKQVREREPESLHSELRIVSGGDRRRRVEPVDPTKSDPGLAEIGDLHLTKLEVDPVIQAVGRVRFLTKPRTVVTFAMHDLESLVGPVDDCATLGDLVGKFHLPSANHVDWFVEGLRARALIGSGLTAEQAARRLKLSRRTFFLRLKSTESADSDVFKYIQARICTPPHADAGESGAEVSP